MTDFIDRLNRALSTRDPLPQDVRIDLGEDGVVFVDSAARSASASDRGAPLALSTSLADCAAIMDGRLSPLVAVLSGKMSFTGDMAAAVHLYQLLGSANAQSGSA